MYDAPEEGVAVVSHVLPKSYALSRLCGDTAAWDTEIGAVVRPEP